MKTGGYLIVWTTIFLVVLLQADTALPWLVKTLDPLPPVWVAMLSWLPLGSIMVAHALMKPHEDDLFHPGLAAVAALPGLLIATQVPLVINGRHPSAQWVAATVTDTGVAFSNGFLWGGGLVLLWGIIYLAARSEFGKRPWPRAFAIGALVASLLGLTMAVITL